MNIRMVREALEHAKERLTKALAAVEDGLTRNKSDFDEFTDTGAVVAGPNWRLAVEMSKDYFDAVVAVSDEIDHGEGQFSDAIDVVLYNCKVGELE